MISNIFKRKVDQESKVERVVDEASTLGQASLRIIAKNTLTFKAIARDLRSLNKAFSNLVKLYGITPAEGEKLNDLKKELSSHDDMKVARVKVTKERREKPRTFMASVLDKILKLIFAAVVGTLLAVGYVTYKLVEIVTPYVSSFIETVTSTVSAIGDAIVNFYKQTDFADLFITSFKKYLGFISFGIISEKDVDDALGQAGSFYKTMIGGIGGFLKDAIAWLAPKLQAIGRYIGKDLLGVDIDKMAEKRSAKEGVVKRSQEMQKEYDTLNEKDKELTKKKTDLTDELTKRKQELQKTKQEEEKKKAEEEEKKKGGFFDRLFKKEEKKKEEVKPAPAPTPEVKKEEVKPAAKKEEAKPTPKKEEAKPTPKVDVSKVPADDGSKKPLPEPAKEPDTSVSLKSVVQDNKPYTPIDYSGLKPGFEKLLVVMATAYTKETGQKLQINSAFRSNEEQKQLYDKWIAGGKKGGVVAKPAAPLKGSDGTSGSGSPHTSGTAIDIQAKGQPFGKLSGDVDNPSGWLEKFGLTRPVTSQFLMKQGKDPSKREDWHVTPLKASPEPDSDVISKKGKPVDISSGKPERDYDIGKSSTELAQEQRGQSKPKKPVVVNARTTNNNMTQTDTNLVAAPA